MAGVGPAIGAGFVLEGLALLLTPLAGGPAWAAIGVLATARALGGAVGAVANINQWTLRQTLTPAHLQARVTAAHRCLVYGAAPIGALLAGGLAGPLGLRGAILLCALLAAVAPLWVICSPLRQLRDAPVGAPVADAGVG